MTARGSAERPRRADPPVDSGEAVRADPPAALEERLALLVRAVDELRRRVERLEGGSAASPSASRAGPALPGAPPVEGAPLPVGRPAAPTPTPSVEAPSTPFGASTVGEQLTLIGRTLLVVGGGYLLRALTDSGAVPVALGVVLGLVYAGVWVLQSHRVAERSPAGAAYHAAAAALLGYPLLWEAVTRFDLLAPWAAAAGMALLTAPLFVIARMHGSPAIAWIAVAGCTAGVFAGVFGARAFAPSAALAVALGLGALALAWSEPAPRAFRWVGWAAAAVADLAALLLAASWLMERPAAAPAEVEAVRHGLSFAVLLALPVGYTALFGLAVLPGWRRVGLFVAAQTAAAWLVGAGGAWLATRAAPGYPALLGAALFAAGAAAYLVAFRGLEQARRRRLHYFATLGLATTAAGTALLLPAPSWLWSPLAVALAWLGGRYGRLSFSLHAALYAAAAAAASGLVTAGALALAAPARFPWPPWTAAAGAAWAASLACLALPPPAAGAFWGAWRALPRLILLAVAAIGAAAASLAALAALVPAVSPGPAADGGLLALARTAVLALLAVAAGLAGRSHRLAEAGRLVYPLLGLGALKLLVEDLPQGRPATLFASLALFGTALILAPRLRRGPS